MAPLLSAKAKGAGVATQECYFQMGKHTVREPYGLHGLHAMEMAWRPGQGEDVVLGEVREGRFIDGAPTGKREFDRSALVHVALFPGPSREGEVAALFRGLWVSQSVQFWLGDWSWQVDTCGYAVGKEAEEGVLRALRKHRRAALRRAEADQQEQDRATRREAKSSMRGCGDEATSKKVKSTIVARPSK